MDAGTVCAVLHFGSAGVGSAGADSAGAQPSPVWAGIAEFPPVHPPDDLAESTPSDPPTHVSPLQRKQLAPLAFATSAPEPTLPTPTFGPTPYADASSGPTTQACCSSGLATPRTSLHRFATPCGTEPSSSARAPAAYPAPGLSPLNGAYTAAGAASFIARHAARENSSSAPSGAAGDSANGRVTPRIAGIDSDIPSATVQPSSDGPSPAGSEGPAVSGSSMGALAGPGLPGVSGGAARPTGIRRSVAAGARRSWQSQDVMQSRLPRAPTRVSGASA